MKKPTIVHALLLAAVLSACIVTPCSAGISKVSCSSRSVSQYEPVDISAAVSADYSNPYDAAQIAVDAVITSPSGVSAAVPAFYSGSSATWNVRFTPLETGKYSYLITSRSGENTISSPSYNIEVSKGGTNGFLRKCPENPYYLVFDSGKPFFGLGHNVAWAPADKAYVFEKYFKLFNENGCNLTRIWINVPWSFPLEWDKLGKYSAVTADKIDSIIKLAEQYGIYIVLVLDSYSSLMAEAGPWGEDTWSDNPYNARKGGPCKEPWDFFSNDEAKTAYKNRLRYVVGRWGYSPNILAFELWNELDAPAEWVTEMAGYIRSINPHGQLIATSNGYPWSNNFDDSQIWKLDAIDFMDVHIYGDQVGNAVGALVSLAGELTKDFKKGLLIGEFGMSAGKSDNNLDPQGLGDELHNSLWAAAMSRSFAGAMNWWWEEYVKAKNLYPHYKALRNFVEGVNWASSRAEALKTGPVTLYMGEKRASSYSDVKILTKELWGNTAYGEFTVGNDGSVLGGIVNAYLQGKLHEKTMKVEPVFHVDYPVDGKFIIKIGMVSQGGNLVVYLDGEKAFEQDFPAGAGDGPWKKSTYRPDYKIYQCLYNTDVEIPVKKGKHTIKLTNTGADWIGIKKLTLANYTSSLILESRVVGVELDSEMLLWIQNKGEGNITDASVTVQNTGDATYSVEWWDTAEGKMLSTVNVKSEKDTLTLHIPPFSRDIACKIKK